MYVPFMLPLNMSMYIYVFLHTYKQLHKITYTCVCVCYFEQFRVGGEFGEGSINKVPRAEMFAHGIELDEGK